MYVLAGGQKVVRNRAEVRNSMLLGGLVLFVGACVPMEQSTLTYASRTTIGASISAGPTESGGLDVALGFKESNLGLVPVAVAKYCYKASAAQCQDMIYRMEVVLGDKKDSLASLPIEMRLRSNETEYSDLDRQRSVIADRIRGIEASQAKFEDAQNAQTELSALAAPVVGEPVELGQRRSALAARIAASPGGFDAVQANKELGQLSAQRQQIEARMTAIQADSQSQAAKLGADSNHGRRDALSIYGKFDGSTTGGANGGSLTAGKIFATGVAAQNLTEFSAVNDCLSTIKVLADAMPAGEGDKKAELLASASDLCKSHK